MENYLKLKKEKLYNNLPNNTEQLINEKVKVQEIDYYYSNVIARASKTMSECRNNFLKLNKTGTDG